MIKKSENKKGNSISIIKLVPNMVTIIGLCIGLSSIRFAFKEQWEIAVAFIIFASCIDGIDGFLARKLDASSNFGAQLDSLSDFLNFGIAPAIVVYLWLKSNEWLPDKGDFGYGVGWATVLLYVTCCAIRLARFNCDMEDETEEPPEYTKKFFTGVPAPAGAIFACGPMITTFALAENYPAFFDYVDFVQNPFFACFNLLVAAILMASRIPTISFKKIKIPKEKVHIVLILVAIALAFLFTEPWMAMVFVGLWYYVSLPLSSRKFMKLKNEYLRKNETEKK